MADAVRTTRQRLRINSDGTVTLFHSTSLDNRAAILQSGQFLGNTWFAPSKAATLGHTKSKHGKNLATIELRVDPRSVSFSTGTGEFYAPDGLARTEWGVWQGEPLTAADRATTESAAFKRWFEGSSVVDQDGRPIVVYHGTKADFSVLDARRIRGRNEGAGFYFTTDKSVAAEYSNGTHLIDAYLSIKNPLPYDAPAFRRDEVLSLLRHVAEVEAKEVGISIKDGFLSSFCDTYEVSFDRAVSLAARELLAESAALDQLGGLIGAGVPPHMVNRGLRDALGYDGFVSNGYDNAARGGGTIYIAMESHQIKSANRNTGEFNADSPDILHSVPEVDLGHQVFLAYTGTSPGAPLVGAVDVVSGKRLDVLWAGSTRQMAEQFQDGEIRKLAIRLANPLVIHDGDDNAPRAGLSHAQIVRAVQALVDRGEQSRDGVIFKDTVDGMEVADVCAVFPRNGSVDHAVTEIGRLTYGEDGAEILSGDFQVASPQEQSVQRVRSAVCELLGRDDGQLDEGIGRVVVTTSAALATGGRDLVPAAQAGRLASLTSDSDVGLHRMLARIRRAHAKVVADVGDFSEGVCLAHKRDSRWVMILRDVGHEAHWRVQYFDQGGFSGHEVYPSKSEAIDTAVRMNFTRRDDGALDRLFDTPAFQRGLYAADLIRRHNAGEISYAKVNELMVAYRSEHDVLSSLSQRVSQAFFVPRDGTIYLVADRIRKGDEAAVFLHECVHKHGRTVMGPDGWKRLLDAPKAWAVAKEGSIERRVYEGALLRAKACGQTGALFDEELFAYCVETAVSLGLRPSAMATPGGVQSWLADVVATLRGTLLQLGVHRGNRQQPPVLSMQQVVDLSFALAQMESPDRARQIREALRDEGPELDEMLSRLRRTNPPWDADVQGAADLRFLSERA